MRSTLAALFLLTVPLPAAAERPNVLVVLTDDLGFSDLGCYGSEIATPTLDRLASNGLRFSQFYNTAKCHSSRVSLLTGRWCRQAGDEPMTRAVTLPEVLRGSGYFTAICGKWHLAKEPGDYGFDRFFGHLSGATNYFTGDHTFRLNGSPWQVPEKGFYTTTANVDYALRFLKEARDAEKPWFLYLALNAPHAPIQPLREDFEKYQNRYTGGWDEIHARRFAKQTESGLLPAGTRPAPRPSHIPAWESLPPDTRDWESRRMAGYAALIDRIDRELTRLVSDLEQANELDNTLILFFSDNGACPYDRRNRGKDLPPWDPATHWTDSTGWAWARNTPFRFYKQNQHEGGIATPAIAHWPRGIKAPAGSVDSSPAHLVDVLPTVAEIAGASIPESWPGREPTPLAGISLAPVLNGGSIPKRPPIHFLFNTDRALRDGDWKITSFRGGPWELYQISSDRTELNDLAGKHPEIVARMSAEWHRITREDLKAPPGEQQEVSSTRPDTHPEWTDFTGKRKPAGKGKPSPP